MKKIFKKITSCVLALSIAFGTTISANALESKTNDNNIISNSAYEDIETYIGQINENLLKLQVLESQKNSGYLEETEYTKEKNDIKSNINKLKSQIESCGADTLDDRRMQEVLTTADYSNSEISLRNTSNPVNLVSQLNQSYHAFGTRTTHVTGGEEYQIYEITVMGDPDKHYGIDLSTVTTGHVLYDDFSSGSTDALYWVGEVLNYFISNVGTSVLEEVTGIKYIPYELLFTSKPTASQISSSGNATVLTLNTSTTIKFTYVLNENTNTWVLCLATNKVSAALSCTECVSKNGTAYNKTIDHPSVTLYGGINSSLSSAVTIYKSMQQNSYISSGNLGIDKVVCHSKYKSDITHSIPCPNSPLGL